MRLYYFDDSGQRQKAKDSKYFILAGFGIDADQVPALNETVRRIASLYGISLQHPAELKFSHVGLNRHPKGGKKRNWLLDAGLESIVQRRAAVTHCLAAALSTPTVSVIGVAVALDELYGDGAAIGHAIHPLLERVDRECWDRSDNGMVFMDEERAHDADLRYWMRTGSFYSEFTRLYDTISFMPSDEAVGVQIADLVAGGLGRYLNHPDKPDGASYARLLWPYLRRAWGTAVGYGIKRFPTHGPAGGILAPPPCPVPWPESERHVHELMMGKLRTDLIWYPDGQPSIYFDVRPDVAPYRIP